MDGSQVASLAIAVGSLVVAVVAVSVAVWQGRISKRQLELSQKTESDTRAVLQEIRDTANESKLTIAEMKSSLDERITKILDLRLEAEKLELDRKRQTSEQGAVMAEKAMGWVGGKFAEMIEQAQARAAAQDAGGTTEAVTRGPVDSTVEQAPETVPDDLA